MSLQQTIAVTQQTPQWETPAHEVKLYQDLVESESDPFAEPTPEEKAEFQQNITAQNLQGKPQLPDFRTIASAAMSRGESRILPIAVGAKSPLIKWSDEPINTETMGQWILTAPRWVEELAKQFPNANGCVLAKPYENMFLDIDTMSEFISGYEKFSGEQFPKTYTTSASNNHCQMHFAQTDKTREMGNISQFAVDGIDLSVRQCNQYVLAEHSQYKNLVDIYRCVDGSPIIPMPDRLMEYIQYLDKKAHHDTTRPSSGGTSDNWVSVDITVEGAPIPHGQHDSTLFKIASSLRQRKKEDGTQWDKQEALEHLIEVCKARCVNYGTDYIEMCENKIKSAWKYEVKEVGAVDFSLQAPGTPQERVAAQDAAARDAAARLQRWMRFTDVNNSKLFVEDHKQDVRVFYGGTHRTWYIWDGTRWKKDSGGVILMYGKQTMEKQSHETVDELAERMRNGADEQERKTLLKNCMDARACLSDYRIRSMLNLASGGTEISVKMTDLDAQSNLLNFNNGTYDFNMMSLRPHCKDDLLTQVVPINFDPTATCPKWLKFIDRIFRDKPYMPSYIQRVVGYCLPGRNPEQVFFLGYGLPGGGKTTFSLVLRALYGEYFQTATNGMFLMSRHGHRSPDQASPSHMDLYGSRLVVSEELGEDARLDCNMIKKVTGGGDVNVRPLYQENFTYTPDYKILFLTNHAPKIQDFSGGIEDRLRVITFNQKIRYTSEDKKDYHLELLDELPGILNWALEGLRQQKQNGLQDPAEVMLATKEFMMQENEASAWLEERTEANENGKLMVKPAYEDFLRWARDHGYDIRDKSSRWFALRLTHLLGESKNSNGLRFYYGRVIQPPQLSGIDHSGSAESPKSIDLEALVAPAEPCF